MKHLILLSLLLFAGCGYQLRMPITKKTLAPAVTPDGLKELPKRQRSLALTLKEMPGMSKICFLMFLGGLLVAGIFKFREALIVALVGVAGLVLIVTLSAYGDWIGLIALVAGTGATGYYIWKHFKQLNSENTKYKTGFSEVVHSIQPFVTEEFKKVAKGIQSKPTRDEVKKIITG